MGRNKGTNTEGPTPADPPTTTNRRKFLKAGALGVGAAGLAAFSIISPVAQAKPPSPSTSLKFTLRSFDMLPNGSGDISQLTSEVAASAATYSPPPGYALLPFFIPKRLIEDNRPSSSPTIQVSDHTIIQFTDGTARNAFKTWYPMNGIGTGTILGGLAGTVPNNAIGLFIENEGATVTPFDDSGVFDKKAIASISYNAWISNGGAQTAGSIYAFYLILGVELPTSVV